MSAPSELKHVPSRRARSSKPNKEPQSRAESEAGGVRLPQHDDPSVSAPSSSNRRKRRPRKLAGSSGEDKAEANTGEKPQKTGDVKIGFEVEALKSKVLEIEAQVQEILLRPTAPQGPTKSARRRARHQKNQGSTRAESEPVEAEIGDSNQNHDSSASESRSELERLQKELLEAQGELSNLKARKNNSPTDLPTAQDDQDIEDIPRLQAPGLEVERPRPLGRAVTLSGSYRIPLPIDVSNADLDAISRGIKSAQNIARSFIDSDHARRSERPEPQASNSGSWSEWFGGYSMSVAKAVDSVRITSSLETVPKRPAIGQRAESAPPRRKPQKLEVRSKKRPDMPDAQRKLSETQVAGLLA